MLGARKNQSLKSLKLSEFTIQGRQIQNTKIAGYIKYFAKTSHLCVNQKLKYVYSKSYFHMENYSN